jgi:hypothetical protein
MGARHQLKLLDSLESLHTWSLAIGGISLRIASAEKSDAMVCPSLRPFQITKSHFDIEMTVKSVPDLFRLPWHRLFDSGSTWYLCQIADEFVFDFWDASFGKHPYKRLVIDAAFTCAALQVSESAFRPYARVPSPLGYPLDELLIMHRLTQEKAIELHGTGIVRDNGDANLFVGHSGAGKSTTTRLWTELEDVEILSDDRIIVRRDETATANLEEDDCATEVGILRLRDRSASPNGHSAQHDKRVPYPAQGDKQIPRFARNDKRMRMYGTPWHGEAMFASPNSAPLSRIFILEHGHGNVITPLTPSQAVAELFARSFVPFHRHEYVDSALVFLEELANSVPVYRYSFEPDQRAVEKIRKFRD